MKSFKIVLEKLTLISESLLFELQLFKSQFKMIPLVGTKVTTTVPTITVINFGQKHWNRQGIR